MIGKHYSSINDCTLEIFISVLITGDVKKLVRYGFFRSKKLVKAWDNIFDEYLKENNSGAYVSLLRKMKDVAMSKNKIRLSVAVVRNLELKYNETMIECLRILGYRYRFDKKNPEQYFQDLEKVKKEIKNLTIINRELEEKLRGKEKETVKEQDFDSLLVELGRFQGYRLNKKEITVSEFIQMLKNYKTINSTKNGK
jgi:hypothetical protein